MRELVPTFISLDTMEHIQSRPGRGYIKGQEIRDVLGSPDKPVERNKTTDTADLFVRGTAQNGKNAGRMCYTKK